MAVLALFATSCDKNLDLDAAGDTSLVSFKLVTPEMGTRAYSDGTTATHLQYAVYNAAGVELRDLTVTNGEIHGSTTVNLQLVTGNTYTVIFWAAAQNAPYTVNFAEKKMTVNYNGAVSNDENRDAFYACKTFTVNGAQVETVELKRPFAQLNIGTADYDAAESAGYVPTQSAVTVKNVYTTLDLATGEVTGEVEANFALADIKTDETFPVTGYEYLAMNYVLVSKDDQLVDIEFTYTDGINAKTRTVGSAPVQRNYRTNIYGNILTSDVDINVEIKPGYNEPSHELDALHKAALEGGEVTLTENVELTAPLEITSDMVINLDGYTISGAYSKSEGHIIKNNGTLKLVGGTVSSIGANGGSAIANYGTLVVEGTAINGSSIRENSGWPSYPINNYGDMTLKNVTITGYQGAIACGDAGTTILENCTINKEYLNTSSHVFYIYHADANVIVNSGTYTHKGMDGSLAYVSEGSITVNGGTFSASNGGYGMASLANGKVIVNGGSFETKFQGWGGLISIAGGDFNAAPNAAWIAEGYKAIDKNGKWYVVTETVDAVASTTDELKNALANGSNVYLAAGQYTMPASANFSSDDVLICAPGAVFTGSSNLNINGATIVGATFSNPSGNAVGSTINGTFKGCTFTGSNTLRDCYVGTTTVFEDCVFDGSVYAIHFDGGENKEIVFRNCTISGFNALAAAIKMVTFEGCTFVGNGKSGYNGANLWGSAKLINCEFTFNGTTANEWIDCIGANKTYEFENCTVNGVKYDSNNYTEFGKIFSRNNVTVKINGVDCAL